jgi:hypothetical protein
MIESAPSSWCVIDLLDYMLDSGIVIDSSIRVSASGIELLAVDVDVVVVSATVHLAYAALPLPAVRSRAIASEVTPTPTEETP